MANLTGYSQTFDSDTTTVDTSAKTTILTRAFDSAGNEYIYLKGVASTIVGSVVTYDEDGVTTLIVANAIGPVAVSMSITDSTSEYGWKQIWGEAEACVAANCADNATLGFEKTSGYVGDGRAAGDMLMGAISREATGASAAVATIQINYPWASDNLGS